jgi:hypothetical protein
MKKIIFLIIFLVFTYSFAQELNVSVDISAGSGIQAGIGAIGTQWNHSPVFTDFEIMINTDNDPFFEYGFSLNVPIERRVGFGIVPKIKLKKTISQQIEIYGIGGAVFFLAGIHMFGLEIETGIKQKINTVISIFAESQFAFYPLGDDLMEIAGKHGLAIQLNMSGGVSFKF